MIDLQYAAVASDNSNNTTENGMNVPTNNSITRSVMGTAYPNPGSSPPPSLSTGSSAVLASTTDPTTTATSANPTNTAMNNLTDEEEGVGQGQLLFPSDYPKPPPSGPSMPLHYDTYQHPPPPPQQHLEDDELLFDSHVEPPPPTTTCGCLEAFFVCCERLAEAEALHRSFCLGAIDGILTGAGIVAAFVGLGLLGRASTLATRWCVVAVCTSAGASDALGMALGHVWSTYVMTTASATEQRQERTVFEQSRPEAKGKLVDMLLSRGMLKIDAMSIADTLEGYPDIFVSALVGDSGYALGGEEFHLHHLQQQQHNYHSRPHPPGVSLYAAHRSYGSFNEWDYDPESAGVAAALVESRNEALTMMISFALFSVVPALIHLLVSQVIVEEPKGKSGAPATSVTSVAMTIICLIMVLLGIWKSTFFDSNWALFGIETVLVLFLCVTSAFFLGMALASAIPSDHLFGCKTTTQVL